MQQTSIGHKAATGTGTPAAATAATVVAIPTTTTNEGQKAAKTGCIYEELIAASLCSPPRP